MIFFAKPARASRSCPLPLTLGSLPLWLSVALFAAFPRAAESQLAPEVDGSADEEFFEREIRPVLIEHCSRCHGAQEQRGGLRVDSRESLIGGGETAAAIVPSDVAGSLLLRAVRRQGDLQMPPDETLPARNVRALEAWVRAGAPWPATERMPAASPGDAETDHWAFQPIQLPTIPETASAGWARTPVDAFVAAKLRSHDLAPSPPADRRTLLRRITYSLTGLPPTAGEVQQFIDDPDPRAYEKVVERLLKSPHYGEKWARHWLDVARYSDTKGYVYAREERFWTHAWTYRDWVVRALNEDMPYDRFLLLQLAADQVADRRPDDLAAMGFLTLGRRFLGVRRDVIDDRIDVVCRGTMGLTVSCARCHDHKYDPIPTADYYSLYGIFDSCMEKQTVLAEQPGDDAFCDELKKRQLALESKLAELRSESSQRARERIADYLYAQSELHKFPANGFDQIFQKSDLLPAFVRRWERYLRAAKIARDPIFVIWHEYAVRESSGSLGSQSPATGSNPLIAEAFNTPPESFREVCERYAGVFSAVDERWREAKRNAEKKDLPPPTSLEDPDAEALRQVLYGEAAPCRVPDGPISHVETFFDTDSVVALWKLQGEVDRWLIKSSAPVPVALALIDQPSPVEPRIFRRGNPLQLGADVPRRFLSVLSDADSQPFRHGSGRRELAEAIIDPRNPLTPRVLVNRVWAHHFGQGLVTTPSDFGLRASPPSHPDLLDWLASRFVDGGWSLKQLHRWIVLSTTYRQASTVALDPEDRRRQARIDPENRFLWRMAPRRLSFEETRDSLLQATGNLDRTIGGSPRDLFARPFSKRRTLYGLVDRQYFPSVLRVFDFANPDLHVPQRSETTVAQQALFLMNHPLVLEIARALAELGRWQDDARSRVVEIFRRVYQRDPSETEIAESLSLVEAVGEQVIKEPPPTAADWQYGYGSLAEGGNRTGRFLRLPHFTGEAWQGGAAWPDDKLGWVRLTAAGGHPGNDHDHAAIRRWAAPRDMTIAVRSQVVHEPAAGDGIRVTIVSSESGVLESAAVHQTSLDLNVDALAVKQGTAIDFIVDIADELDSDQFTWSIVVEERKASADGARAAWDSTKDFPDETAVLLDAWSQLAQVLLCANEFVFVD